MRQSIASLRWLALTVVSAGLLPFACNKEEPATETAPSAVVEAVASVEPVRQEATTDPAVADAPTAGASASSAAAASAAAADAPTAGGAAKTPANGRPPTASPPSPPTPPAPPAGYTGPDPCRATSFKFASVRNACSQGGVKQAKSVMKGMVKRAKDDGKDIKCSSCHEDTKTYTLKSNAVDDMRALQ